MGSWGSWKVSVKTGLRPPSCWFSCSEWEFCTILYWTVSKSLFLVRHVLKVFLNAVLVLKDSLKKIKAVPFVSPWSKPQQLTSRKFSFVFLTANIEMWKLKFELVSWAHPEENLSEKKNQHFSQVRWWWNQVLHAVNSHIAHLSLTMWDEKSHSC